MEKREIILRLGLAVARGRVRKDFLEKRFLKGLQE